jgi:hypothetical protein
MGEAARPRPGFGEGPLSRGAALVYTLIVVELLLLATALPGLVPLVLLARDVSNAPLAALCLLPLGPALSAALYALHNRSRDIADLRPARAFWRGYRLNLGDSLLVYVPWLVWLTIVAVGLGNLSAAGLPAWWAVLLVVVAIAATLWLANALVICSLFAFRTLDVARLAAYFLVRTPGGWLGNAGLLILAAGVTALSSEAVLTLLGSAFCAAMLRTSRPMVAVVRAEFVA